MILSDATIRKELAEYKHWIEIGKPWLADHCIGISPFDPSLIQPCSVDVRLGSELRFIGDGRTHRAPLAILPEGDYLLPLQFALGHTLETVSIPSNILCNISGKSSLGRLGLSIHTTAGLIDPGFKGQITLELFNMSSVPIKLTAGMLIAQLSFQYLDHPAERPYGSQGLGSHYQGQMGATPSAKE